MKITIEEQHSGEEEIIIRCNQVDDDIVRILSFVKAQKNAVVGYDKDNLYRLQATDIYYFEAVDNKVFIYCKKDIFESKQKLYEIEKELLARDFFRVTKSIIVNLTKIKYVSPAFNGRFEATLLNGEKIIISRQYVPEFKKRLVGEL